MKSRNPTEDDLKQFQANMQRIKVGGGEGRLKNLDAGGGSRVPVPTSPRARSKSAPPLIQSFFVPGPLPGANDIIRKHHMVYSKLKSQWGLTIARCIIVAKIKRVHHCHVAFTWNELHDRRDPDNVIFGQKFVLDALRDTKIIPNDTREFILSLTHCVLTYSSKPGVFVRIEEAL